MRWKKINCYELTGPKWLGNLISLSLPDSEGPVSFFPTDKPEMLTQEG